MTHPSEYEKSEWRRLSEHRPPLASRGMRAVGTSAAKGVAAAGRALNDVVEGHESVGKVRDAALAGSRWAAGMVPEAVTEQASKGLAQGGAAVAQTLSSISKVGLTPDRVVQRHAKRGNPVQSLSDVRSLDLRLVDQLRDRNLGRYYATLASASGAGAAFAITGGELATAVSGGAAAAPGIGVAIAAVAGDASAVLMLSSRAVGQIGLLYGYDSEAQEEKFCALSVVNLGTAMSQSAKLAALAGVSRLTQALYRGATWKVLNTSAVTRVLTAFARQFGVRLTRNGLGKFVPGVGIVLGAGFNWATLESIVDAADHAYRRRFLLDKYPELRDGAGGDGFGFVAEVSGADDGDTVISVVDDIEEVLGEEVPLSVEDASHESDRTGEAAR